MSTSPVIFCAIDTADVERAVFLSSQIGPVTGGIKLGLEFFNAFGLEGVKRVVDASGGAQLFVDLKFHDIPNTVAGAVGAICRSVQPAYLNVHASGGAEMMKAAKDACAEETKLLAVTILTSLDEDALEAVGYKPDLSARVEQLAKLAQGSGVDGVVCSAHEISRLRRTCGDDFALMVPGIRPEGAEKGDQKRVMTPKQALDEGATYLVIGRPITEAERPGEAAQAILDSLEQ